MKPPQNLIFTLIFILTITASKGQGRLLIAGGGNEKNNINGWSLPAYSWAAAGKRVAIISNDGSGYVPYFKNQCGAAAAKDFIINTQALANNPALYDTLVTYGFIFFAGGDQWDYYANFKGTWLHKAVDTLYAKGGTIGGTSAGMHILSETIFTAKNGTVYPDECVENPLNQYMTLSNDFLHFMPSYIFDTHVAERGRFARLVSFVANRAITMNQKIIGLGLDDMTCMTVDENLVGTVYGTGAATLVLADPEQFSQSNTHLKADSVLIKQLLHGCTFNFLTQETTVSTLTQTITPNLEGENNPIHIFASGSNVLADNTAMLQAYVTQVGSTAKILVVTSVANSTVTQFINNLLLLGITNVSTLTSDMMAGSNPETAQLIHESESFFFVNNTPLQLSTFLETSNGALLREKLFVPGTSLAFVGSDSRLAGAKVIENYTTSGASYYGELSFATGLKILPNTVIMPETYSNSDYYENTATAIPYAMVSYGLGYGIWLTGNNYMVYSYTGSNSNLSGHGKAPVMLLKNVALQGGVSQHTSTGTGGTPRQVAGFDQMLFYALGEEDQILLGSSVGMNDEPEQDASYSVRVSLQNLIVSNKSASKSNLNIFDLSGKKILARPITKAEEAIDLSQLTAGLYIVRIINNSKTASFKIVIH